MKPLVIHPHLHPRRTGVTTHVESIVPVLSDRFDVRVWGRALRDGLRTVTLRALLKQVRNGRAVWHAHRNNELLLGLLLRWVAPGLRVVFTRHTGRRPGLYSRLLARRADRVIGLTPEMSSHFRPAASVVGHGVDLARFHPPADRAAAYRALELPADRDFAVGVLGRVRPEKGHGDFAEALEPVLKDHPRWHAVIVGRVAPTHAAFETSLKVKLGDRVTVTGEARDPRPWYHALSIVVHPSWSEGYSLVLLEAMASGCCVVATSLPYTEGLVEHGRTGFIYPPHDVEALRAILAELLASPSRIEAVGRAAAEEARRRLGVEVEAQRLGDLYEELLRR